jgi:hypothetical protein
MQNRIGIQRHKMRYGWMVRFAARNSLSVRWKEKEKWRNKSTSHKQLIANCMTAAEVCDEHCNGILGHCVFHTLIPDMYA